MLLSSMIAYGVVHNFDAMRKMWNTAFYNHLKALPLEHLVFICECPHCSDLNWEIIKEIMLRKIKSQKLAYDALILLTKT